MTHSICVVAAGVFLIVGMLTGVWKFVQMQNRDDHMAHPYVDIAHRASLLYAFACIVLGELAELSKLSETIELVAAIATMTFFAIAVGTYILIAMKESTENQFSERTFTTTIGMWLLIAAEIGGTSVLLFGAVSAII